MENNPLENFVNSIETIATGIPAPIRKNFFTAFGQLCTAAVDVPVSWLQGQAEIRRANTEARKNIISNISNNIADSIAVPEIYSEKAIERYASKIIKHQINLDDIVKKAATDLSNQKNIDNLNEREISEEWLNTFEEVAKLKSSEDMRHIFGKILAGEIKNPGVFSIRTINIVSQLDSEVANQFIKFCHSCIYVKFDNRILIALNPKFTRNKPNDFSHYGIKYHELKNLQEYGLVHTSESTMDLSDFANTTTSISHSGQEYLLKTLDGIIKKRAIMPTGHFLTRVGEELMSVVDLKVNDEFIDDFSEFLKKSQVQLIKN